jgi:glycosyltransferase involved in cell wall biosynthesis
LVTASDRAAGSIAVSVLVPVLNEELHIREAVARMQGQDLEDGFELIFLDGRSSDRTREILEELAQEDPRIRVFDNPERRTPQALNIGLREARGSLVARMDAHSYYPSCYLSAGAKRLAKGDVDWVSGPQLAAGVDTWSRRVALALSSPLGTGGAAFRRRMGEEVEVDSGFTGLWRRECLDEYGGWDERWPVDQDYELAARMRADGRKIVCIPEMAAEYIPRNSLKRLFKQYWTYGYYRVKTSLAHPRSMRRSHVLPPGLALATTFSLIAPRPLRTLSRLGLGIYALAIGYATIEVAVPGHGRDAPSLPLVFACMHLAAGFGFLAGCVRFGPPVAALASLRR